MDHDYDIVVLGSGIAGSITALVLKQIGLSTLVVERKSHPRFVIGESTLPTTSLLLHNLANTYGIPELSQIAHYLTLRRNGLVAWPKQHFWYGLHQPGTPLQRRHEHMFEGLLLPMGPDAHVLRADVDGFLASRLERYGIDYLENTEVVDFHAEAGGVRLRIDGAQGARDVKARLVVDATGHASFLARRFGIRDEDARLDTNTRSLFGHFKGVRDLDEAVGGLNPQFRFRRRGGTMHHCFHGGWIWVIPFDNGVTSVGVQLDRRIYPLDERITPEQELRAIIERYPSVRAHLGDMEPVRPLIRTERVQFTCSSLLGEGFILTPHAGAFIEPLFSTGILLTLSFVSRFAYAAREAHAAGDFSAERFRFVERHFFAEVRHIDRIVNGIIQSFRHYDLFKQYWRYWVIGTFSQWCTAALAGGATREVPMLYGSGVPGFQEELEVAHQMVTRSDVDPAELAVRIQERVERWWEPIAAPILHARGSLSVAADDSVCVHGAGQPDILMASLGWFAAKLGPLDATLKLQNAEAWMEHAATTLAGQLDAYGRSRREGSDFHVGYDRILDQQNPSTFDYYMNVGIERS